MSPPLTDAQAGRVERHTKLVRASARRIAASVGTRLLSIDELESAGFEALVEAAMRYDPSGAASFATFAHYRVYGAMIDAIRKRSPGLRAQQRALVRLTATQALLSQAAEDQAAQRSSGQQLALEQRVESARELVRRATLAMCLAEPGDLEPEALVAEQPDPEQRLLDDDTRRRMWSMIAELDEHERALIEAIYEHGRSMKDYAEQLGVSIATVSRRHARTVDRLGKRMRASEGSRVDRR